MALTVDYECDDYRFYKTLNEDILLKPDEHNRFDMQFKNGDLVNVTGHDSLHNAICIAIMTRHKEIKNELYSEFGCRIHELIKANKSNMILYKIELFIVDILEQMRRVQKINWINIEDSVEYTYCIYFSVTSINDEIVEGSVNL